MMDGVTNIIHAIYRGFMDSLRGGTVLFYMDKQINEKLVGRSPTGPVDLRKRDSISQSPSKHSSQQRESKVLKRTIQCCALNGGVFWASILIFDYGLLPLIKYLLTIIFGHSPGTALTVWSWTQPFLSLTFGTVWVLPLFLLSRIVNSLWFQDIADSAYRYRQGRPMLLSSVSKLIADTLFSILVQALFLGQGMLVSKVPLPLLGELLALVHMCLLYALYAFEYKWFNMGWELHKRLTFIEGNWPYFIGFGLPLAVLTQLPNSYFISGCVFSILFPLFIVSGNEAEPVTGVCDYSLKLFSPVIAIANTLFNKTIGRAHRRDILQVSFHLPLHRYFAVFMCQAIRQQGASLHDLLPPMDMLHLLMMHPLRVQVAFYEILNGLWVRNGLQIKGQAMTYIQCNFCNSMVDADLYLLQICATKLPPDIFLKTIIEKFHVREWMSLCQYHAPQNEYLEGEHDTPMLESCLTFLATLINVRTNLGLSDAEMSCLEMVTLLCMGDKTHSQLMELMPERCGTTQNRDFESVLADVAQYRAPNLEASGNMQQGMYGPKPHVWDELFDPLHVLLRAVHRRDFQISMDRFTEYVKQSGKLKNSATPWPPFRHPAPVSPDYDDPRIVLRSRVFHAAIFVILYKAVNGHNVSEHVMALVIYLLEMAVVTAETPDKSVNPLCPYTGGSSRIIRDMDLAGWYESDNLSENLRAVIPRVVLVQESEPNSSDSEFEWEVQGEMSEAATPLMLNDSPDDGVEESSFELLGLPSAGSVRVDNGSSSTSATSLPALPSSVATNAMSLLALPSAASAASLPALPSAATATSLPALPSATSTEYGVAIIPENRIVAIPSINNANELIPVQRALPTSREESMILTIESPPSPNNVIGGQPSPSPLRLEIMARNEMVATQQTYSPLRSISYSDSEVPSTQTSPHKHFKRREPQIGPMQPQTVKVGESIISLLLKLHSQLSGVPDSYNPEQSTTFDNEAGSSSSTSSSNNESRIGDGPFFISQLLRKIADVDPICKDSIIETRNRLWPRMQECEGDEQREREHREREERRRRAKERQQKLMAEFANKQKQFMEKAMQSDEAGSSGMDWEQEENATKLTSKKEYDCVICNRTTPSSEDKPMGLVVLVQATSVIGHERQQSERLVLPTSDEDPSISKGDTRGAHFNRKLDEFCLHFDTLLCFLSLNLGWQGGVHVQTCGHHLHLDCLKSYLQSLRSQQRHQNLAVDRGEYFCPLCRQLANSVLPLSPQLGECAALVRSRHASPATILSELNNFLKEIPRDLITSNLFAAMGKSMEDMTGCTYSEYKQKKCNTSSHQSLFLFITSVARINIEIEIVQRGGSLCIPPPNTIPLTPKRDCIVALLHVLAMHARILATWPVHNTWQQLSGIPGQLEPASSLALTPHEKEVPLLLKDPTALLIQFILLLPLHLDQTYFSSVVKVIYNLLYYQVILQISCNFSQAERNTILKRSRCGAATSSETILAKIIKYFDDSELYSDDDGELDSDDIELFSDDDSNACKPSTSSSTFYARVKTHCIEQQIQSLCLPFLRVASLLRYHLYEQPLPQIRTQQSEFVRLVYYLELVTEGMDWDSFNSTVALNWQDGEASVSVPQLWCDQLLAFVNRFAKLTEPVRSLVAQQHISWQMPKLLSLPREYEKIFTYYHERHCSKCQSIPQEISICLLCGTIVCLKQNCCKQHNTCEAINHSIECGGGTGIYLVVTSTYIIVIRGRRACLWGSLYLDDFEEEDRDLKRGKPLYLSRDRYQLLEQQWLAHRFDHTKKTWVWHRDAL